MNHPITGYHFTDFTLDNKEYPITKGLILRRAKSGNEEIVETNVLHLLVEHSPTGFEFGYGGSGPADLALNTVEIILHYISHKGPRMACLSGNCFQKAYELHQEFKWKFIASAHRNTTNIIPYEFMEKWVQEKLEE